MKISKLKSSIHLFKCSLFAILVGSTVPVFAQTTANEQKKVVIATDSVTGKVIDAVTKNPLAGARINTTDPRFSAMTDENGNYSIKIPKFLNTLIVSAPGFDKKEVSVYSGQQTKNVSIYPSVFDNVFADEVGVYGTKRKTTISTAMNSFILDNQSSYTVDNELKKQMAGDIYLSTHSGTPGAGARMLIRGINSLNSNTQPLIVVDGVIFDNLNERNSLHQGNFLNPLSGIDMNDIESVTVLKDGTSMYGSKGGNGVILINTKRGRSMATKITVSGMLGYNQQPLVTPMMNADQYRIYLSDLLKNKDASDALSEQHFLNNDPDFIYYNKYHNSTQWSDGVYRNGSTQSYNVAVNGGDEIALYNLSIGLTNALSTLENNDFNRINARFNSDINLTDKLNTVFDISYLQSTRKLRNDGIAENYRSQINSPGFLSLIKSPFLSPYQYSNDRALTTKLEDYDFLKIANPYAILEYGIGHSQQTNFNLSVVPEYTLNKNLSISSRFSFSMINLSENMYSPMYGVAPYIEEENKMISNNHVKTQFARQTSLLSDTRVKWGKSVEEHDLKLNAGLRYMTDSYKAEYAEGHNTGSDQVREMSGSLLYKAVDGADDPYKLLTYYGVFNYGFRDKYFAEAAISLETSSRFGNKTNSGLNMLGVSWAVFPSLNVAWLISAEDFMQSVNFVDMLKLRSGIGASGNDDIESTAARTYFNAVKFGQNITGVQLHNIANPAIQWETVIRRNAGLDAAILNNRLSLSFDVYNNSTNNLLVLKTPAPYSGMGTYWTNDGKLSNFGYEGAFNARIISTKNINVTLGASISAYKNEILALADGDYLTKVYGAEILTAVNQPIGQFYGYQTNGVYSTAEEAALDGLSIPKSNGELIALEAGDMRFIDKNNDKVIDDQDKVVIGNSNPDFFGAINAGMKYKNLGIQLVFNYNYGNDIYNYLRSQLENGSTFSNQSMAMNNRWINEGSITNIPQSVYGDPKGNNRFSDRWIEDGSYLRLKTIEVSYDLPVNKINFLQGITLWASANNLFTLTNYLGMDPEFSSGNSSLYQGIDIGLLPQSRSFFAGFKVYL
ncbi:MAG: SusC/RagA family TonB-linked outer membrane protein [Paludibacteraceae bacterium]|nr:SusC/RagA family TonB-linked outer membrane protein [Paludibacteraceae bacterium]